MSTTRDKLKSPEAIAARLRVTPREVRVAAAELDLEPAALRCSPRFDEEQARAIAQQIQNTTSKASNQ